MDEEALDDKDDEEFVIVTPRHRQTRHKNASGLSFRSREGSGPNFQETNRNDRKPFQPKFRYKPFKQQRSTTVQSSRVEYAAGHKTHNHSKPTWPQNTDSFDPLSCDASFIHVSVGHDVVTERDKIANEAVVSDANVEDVESPADEDEDISAELPEDLSEITCTSSLSQDLTVTDLCDVEPYKFIQTQGIKQIKNSPDNLTGNFNYESILKFIKEGKSFLRNILIFTIK